MVFNTTRMAKTPFSNATHTTHTKVMIGRGLGTGLGTGLGAGLGTGMGSVLLRTGGGGGGSSYSDMDDYILAPMLVLVPGAWCLVPAACCLLSTACCVLRDPCFLYLLPDYYL